MVLILQISGKYSMVVGTISEKMDICTNKVGIGLMENATICTQMVQWHPIHGLMEVM